MERARPPDDITPTSFFLHWVPEAVALDPSRRAKLEGVDATVEFLLAGPGGGSFCIRIAQGRVEGRVGRPEAADLRVELEVETWRRLNRGEMSAPEAVLRRDLKFTGSFLLGLKLHLILG